MTERILVVDDDTQILRALRTGLRGVGYEVILAEDGNSALDAAASKAPDFVVLDLGLPDMDGVEVIERLRSWSDVPIIVLSVRDAQQEKIGALDRGADDYVTKPFDVEELLARMRALRRRVRTEDVATVLRFGDLQIDRGRELVTLNGQMVHLTPTEYKLLITMAASPGKLLTHRWLLGRVWGPAYDTDVLRVFVRQLRQKLADDPGTARFIVTEPGLGYRWRPEADR